MAAADIGLLSVNVGKVLSGGGGGGGGGAGMCTVVAACDCYNISFKHCKEMNQISHRRSLLNSISRSMLKLD